MATKYLDLTGLTDFAGKVKTALSKKVDAVDGMGLSANSYTTEEQTKLAGVASGAQVNVIESITVNGVAATVTDKAASVSVTIPTNVSSFTNDSGYQTASQVTSAITTEVTAITSAEIASIWNAEASE